MSSFGDIAALAVAGLDLKLVDLLVTAMRVADLSGAPRSTEVPSATTVAANQPAASSPVAAKGLVYNSDHPAATFHPQTQSQHYSRIHELLPYECRRPIAPLHHESPVQPPWKILPWPTATVHGTRHFLQPVKILPNRADVTVAGRLLDLFI